MRISSNFNYRRFHGDKMAHGHLRLKTDTLGKKGFASFFILHIDYLIWKQFVAASAKHEI